MQNYYLFTQLVSAWLKLRATPFLHDTIVAM